MTKKRVRNRYLFLSCEWYLINVFSVTNIFQKCYELEKQTLQHIRLLILCSRVNVEPKSIRFPPVSSTRCEEGWVNIFRGMTTSLPTFLYRSFYELEADLWRGKRMSQVQGSSKWNKISDNVLSFHLRLVYLNMSFCKCRCFGYSTYRCIIDAVLLTKFYNHYRLIVNQQIYVKRRK